MEFFLVMGLTMGSIFLSLGSVCLCFLFAGCYIIKYVLSETLGFGLWQ